MILRSPVPLDDGRYVFAKEIDGEWWGATVEIEGGIGKIVSVKIMDHKPVFDESNLVYSIQ